MLRASEVRNTSCNVYWERNVLMDPFPLVVSLPEVGADTKREIKVFPVSCSAPIVLQLENQQRDLCRGLMLQLPTCSIVQYPKSFETAMISISLYAIFDFAK
jgi:hypothetical protein